VLQRGPVPGMGPTLGAVIERRGCYDTSSGTVTKR